MANSSRPAWVDDLLARPLPPLTPPSLSDTANPPYREDVRASIADLHCHPCLEACLHLMNDDLFSAHFLLRKLQEDEWGKWLHAILHQAEGDLEKNAKLWYQQVPENILALFWARAEQRKPSEAAIESMYRIMRVRGGKAEEGEEEEARRVKWRELSVVMEELEKKFGWDMVDGTTVYTKDKDPSHKSRVLGEGYRTWDRSGFSSR